MSANQPDDTANLATTREGQGNESELVSLTAQLLAGLDNRESMFVSALLEGKDTDDAAREAGWSGRAVGAKVLGRPRVREAITTLAPLLPVKLGSRMVAPYVLERVVKVALEGSDAQAIHAARDVLNLAGLGPVSRSERLTADLSTVLAALESRRVAESAPVVESTPRKR